MPRRRVSLPSASSQRVQRGGPTAIKARPTAAKLTLTPTSAIAAAAACRAI
jgi:hypothetical protein